MTPTLLVQVCCCCCCCCFPYKFVGIVIFVQQPRCCLYEFVVVAAASGNPVLKTLLARLRLNDAVVSIPLSCSVTLIAVRVLRCCSNAVVAATTATTIASHRGIELIRFDQLLSHGNNPRCYKIKEEEEKEKRKEAKRRRKVRLMPYFSTITATAAPLTIRFVLMECTVYRMVYPHGFMPHTIVIIVLCRDIWCGKKAT